MTPPMGLDLFVGSQWFVVSKEFANYVTSDDELVAKLKGYAKHIAVPDENFFATLLKNSHVCNTHVNKNFLFLQFDDWEVGNPHKCFQPDPKRCGRSPTTITLDNMPAAELSEQLFARKFDASKDPRTLDAADAMRLRSSQGVVAEGPLLLDVQIQWVSNPDLCLELQVDAGTEARLEPCAAAATAEGQSFEIGPCSSDGSLELISDEARLLTTEAISNRSNNGDGLHDGTAKPNMSSGSSASNVRVLQGAFSRPFCPVHAHALRRCLDLKGEDGFRGQPLISYPCTSRWNQLFSFTNEGQIFIHVPKRNADAQDLCMEVSRCNEAMKRVCDVVWVQLLQVMIRRWQHGGAAPKRGAGN